jgi:hypothetical protein
MKDSMILYHFLLTLWELMRDRKDKKEKIWMSISGGGESIHKVYFCILKDGFLSWNPDYDE